MAFVYLRFCDNDFGTEMQHFGDDFLYNWGTQILEMSEEKIKQCAVVFMAGYYTYHGTFRKNLLKNGLMDYMSCAEENYSRMLKYFDDSIKVYHSKHWPSEVYEKYGSYDDGGSLLIDVYGKKCYLV